MSGLGSDGPSDTIPSTAPMDLSFDDLETGESLGRGGNADVFLSAVVRDGERVPLAVKQPRFQGTLGADVIDRFVREAEVWEGLDDHDHVVSLVDWGEEPLPWLAMEYMDGGTLEGLLAEGPLPHGQALWVARCVCEAVMHAHRHGVAHHDIKPANVLLREPMSGWLVPKVSDWGLARLMLEETGSIEGLSPQYAAPEQFDPEGYGSPDHLTDIYQVGVLVYELLAGRPPFEGSGPTVMRAVLNEDPAPPSAVADVPPAVDDAVMPALGRSKADRYEDVIYLRDALDDLWAAHREADSDATRSPERPGAVGTGTNDADGGDDPGPEEDGATGDEGATVEEGATGDEPPPAPERTPPADRSPETGAASADAPASDDAGGVGELLGRRPLLKAGAGLGVIGASGLWLGLDGPEPTDDGGGGPDATDPPPTPTTVSDSGTTRVGMVYGLGGLEDNAFNEMAHNGIQRAASEMPVEFANVEPADAGDFRAVQQMYARSSNPDYDLVCAIGYRQADAVAEVAEQFPDQQFMLVDAVARTEDGGQFPNVASYVFAVHEGSFQVGHLAGLLTTRAFSAGGGSTSADDVVGFVGGKENPLIERFRAGYEAGVHHADGGIEVLSAYAGTYADPSVGKDLALSMYDEGADVIYHVADGTGIGVFQAAQERGRYALGVDADQSRTSPEYSDVILASMVKRVDVAVVRSVERVVEGRFRGGEVSGLGLAEGGVAGAIGQAFEGALPDEVTEALATSRQAIADGQIDVPTEP